VTGVRGRSSHPVAAAPVVVAAAVTVAGCMPAPATEQARAVTDLWGQFLVAAALVGGLVWTLITIAILRFRRPRRAPGASAAAGSLPAQTADSRPLEIAWTAGPIVVVLILFWLTLGALGRIDAREPGRVTVDVTAFRWQWRFDYPGTGVSFVGGPGQVAEMVVPAGEPVHIVLSSVDVAHAFYVPAFLFKRDAIPGRPNEFDLTIAEPGSYGGQCAEFCGVFHDRMLLSVHALSRPDYDAWLAAAAAASNAPAPSASAVAP
jgi:cytochrome c oxidase subunit 2